jgi:hypothetical protein
MEQANDLPTSRLAGSQHEGTPAAKAASSAGLATFLAGLPSAALSETGRRNVCGRFGLTDDELATALAAHGPADEWWALLPVPAKEFGADALACALSLTGTTCPTPAQLDAALLEMYPVGGPTAASLVAAGWLLPTIDKKGLRLPPLPVAADTSPYSPQRNGRR